MRVASLFIIEYIYLSVHALVGRISHNESSMHGHESFKVVNSYILLQGCTNLACQVTVATTF